MRLVLIVERSLTETLRSCTQVLGNCRPAGLGVQLISRCDSLGSKVSARSGSRHIAVPLENMQAGLETHASRRLRAKTCTRDIRVHICHMTPFAANMSRARAARLAARCSRDDAQNLVRVYALLQNSELYERGAHLQPQMFGGQLRDGREPQ